tara:strand:- start:72646 stop:75495 length:2850 start_codon:yes stop_codon:yes gene_type:complete
MLVALSFGLVPDKTGAIRDSRAAIAEAIAVNSAGYIHKNDIERLRTTLRLVIDRNEELLSAAARDVNKEIVVAVGDHERHWQDKSDKASTSSFVKVPVHADDKHWGQIELRFTPLSGSGVYALLYDERFHLLLFVALAGFIAFRIFLGQVLRHLDPAQAVPPHVRSALDTLAEGLIVIDKNENVVLANESFSSIVGKSADELLGVRASELGFFTVGGESVTSKMPWTTTLSHGQLLRNEILLLKDVENNTRSFIVNCSPVLGAGNDHAGVLISLDDVTELEENKTELRKSKDAAEEANKAKSDFLANMSHEIRTPMNAILGFTDVLRRGYMSSQTDRRKYLDTIHSSGEHLLHLINDLLDLSKVEAGHMETELLPVPVHELAREVISVLMVRAQEKGINLEFDITDDIPETIHTDPTRVRQIITNLIGNAIKFTESGGVQVYLGYENNNNTPEYIIRVKDSGIGIKDEYLESIFDPFVQADTSVTRRFGGTGLGLAISRRFARLMGGDIIANSVEGEGTEFIVTLNTGPLDDIRMLTPEEALMSNTQNENIQDANWHFPAGTRVLVVDDGAENRELVKIVLENVGLEISCAENGQEAVQQALVHRFDAILMDVQMPVMDGYQATINLRNEGLDVPIIALTADIMKGFEQKCLAAGFTSFLSKPVDIDKLIEVLAEKLNGSKIDNVEHAPIPDEQVIDPLENNEPIECTLPTANPAIIATVSKFIDGLAVRFEDARQSLEFGDLEEVARFAHWLKGSGGTVGFHAFTQPAEMLEMHIKNGQIKQIESSLNALESISHRLVRPGEAKNTSANAETESLPTYTEAELNEVIEDNSPVVCQLPLNNPRMRQTVEKFLLRLNERLPVLDELINSHQYEQIQEIASWLKGAAGTVGFHDFTEPATALETAATQQADADIQASFSIILDLVRRIELPIEKTVHENDNLNKEMGVGS